MKTYQKFATLALATAITLTPLLSYAKENGAKVESEVKVESMDTNHGFFKNFWLPFGIWKKIVNHATSTASSTREFKHDRDDRDVATTTPAIHVEAKGHVAVITVVGLNASTTYSVVVNGATTSLQTSFTTR